MRLRTNPIDERPVDSHWPTTQGFHLRDLPPAYDDPTGPTASGGIETARQVTCKRIQFLDSWNIWQDVSPSVFALCLAIGSPNHFHKGFGDP